MCRYEKEQFVKYLKALKGKQVIYLARIKEFRFWWADAWNDIGKGYDTILETSDSGYVMLQCLVNGKTQSIELTDLENDLIDAFELCNIKNWDKKNFYNCDYEDGNRWRLYIAYDDVLIRATGMNGYPKEFGQFLDVIVDGLGLQESYYCKTVRANIDRVIKGTKVEEMQAYSQTISSYSEYY